MSLLQGIVRALTEYQHKLLEHNVTIFVRRGGPNYQEGLRIMREVSKSPENLGGGGGGELPLQTAKLSPKGFVY